MTLPPPVPGRRVVFLRDMVLGASLGVNPDELGRTQRVRINVALLVEETPVPCEPVLCEPVPCEPGTAIPRDDLRDVVDYARLAERIRRTVAAGHVRLVETLAERIGAVCFFDRRIASARIRVEKLDVFDDLAAVGVEIERLRP